METFGRTHCAFIRDGSNTYDQRLAATYYDAILGYTQIQNYTRDASWRPCIEAALQMYGRDYVGANNGNVPGFWNFTAGLFQEYLTTGDESARTYMNQLGDNGAFARDTTPNSELVPFLASRENAYALYAKLIQFEASGIWNPRIETLVNNALGHVDQWFVSRSATFIRPFMAALTARSLIKYWDITNDPRVIPAIKTIADNLWSECWLPGNVAFSYTNVDTALFAPTASGYNSGGLEPTPDLNLLIAPLYGFLYHVTGDRMYIERGDQIFSGGVRGAWLTNAKQFNQSYFWSFDYVSWRSEAPVTR